MSSPLKILSTRVAYAAEEAAHESSLSALRKQLQQAAHHQPGQTFEKSTIAIKDGKKINQLWAFTSALRLKLHIKYANTPVLKYVFKLSKQDATQLEAQLNKSGATSRASTQPKRVRTEQSHPDKQEPPVSSQPIRPPEPEAASVPSSHAQQTEPPSPHGEPATPKAASKTPVADTARTSESATPQITDAEALPGTYEGWKGYTRQHLRLPVDTSTWFRYGSGLGVEEYFSSLKPLLEQVMEKQLQQGQPVRMLNVGVADGQEPLSYLAAFWDVYKTRFGHEPTSLDDLVKLDMVDFKPGLEPTKKTFDSGYMIPPPQAPAAFNKGNLREGEGYILKEPLQKHFKDALKHNTSWETPIQHYQGSKGAYHLATYNNVYMYLSPEDQVKALSNIIDTLADDGILLTNQHQMEQLVKAHPELSSRIEKVEQDLPITEDGFRQPELVEAWRKLPVKTS